MKYSTNHRYEKSSEITDIVHDKAYIFIKKIQKCSNFQGKNINVFNNSHIEVTL